MRLISNIDLVNFHGNPQNNRKFEGDIEEQAKILHVKGQKRLIVEVRDDTDMKEEGAIAENGEEKNGGLINGNVKNN